MTFSKPLIAAAITIVSIHASAQTAPPPDSDANPPTTLYHWIGVVTPRSSTELAAAGIASPFSIGAEQTDRNYSTYSNWASYLAPLGLPAARVQTGWADVEKTRGVYDFTKLDQIYDGMAASSVKPLLGLVYGNPLYAGGGSASSGSQLPDAATEARAAWLAFVHATVAHFSAGGRLVTDWEIWNEPSNVGIAASDYATFAAQTAQTIKSVQAGAKILISGTGDSTYNSTVLNNFSTEKGAAVPNADVQVIFHPYNPSPESSYGSTFTTLLSAANAKGFTVRQGESGAPSATGGVGALSTDAWTETRQAKYDLRRLLGDFYRGLKSNLFTITDTHFPSGINSKGTLFTGTWNSTAPTYGDQTVARPKVVYGSVRALTAIFDGRVQPVQNAGCTVPSGYTVQTYTRTDPGNIVRNAMLVWRTTPPGGTDTSGTGINATLSDITVTCTAFQFPRFASNPGLRPRYTDLIAAKVYELLSSSTVVHSGAGVTVTGLRVYDSPVIIADQGIVPITVN